jgi:hypothetical protein
MKKNSYQPYYDDRREVSFIVTAVVFWILVCLFLVLRDPLWRLFYEGRFVATTQSQSGWMGLDENAINQMTGVNVSPRPGLDSLEAEFLEALKQRVASEAARQGSSAVPQLNSDAQLHDIARAQAETLAQTYSSGREKTPDLVYPEIYVSLVRPDRLLRVAEASQPLVSIPPPGSSIPAELVGGWMNNMTFANLIQTPANLDVGVGLVPMPQGQGASVVVLLAQSFVQLNHPLPSVDKADTPFQMSGHRLSAEEIVFYFKGPKDSSFSTLNVQWNGDAFAASIPWSQGPGLYAFRARRADRLSDPRPVLVK